MRKFLTAGLIVIGFFSRGAASDFCSIHPYVTADFIYWKSVLEKTFYAIDGINPDPRTTQNVGQGKAHNNSYDFMPGFKAGLGVRKGDWDVYVNYTWLSKQHDHASVVPSSNSNLQTGWTISTLGGTFISRILTEGSQHLDATFSELDFEILGGNVYQDCHSILHPSIGLKAGWVDHKIKTTYRDLNDYTRPNIYVIDSKQDFWGVGPRASLHYNWFFYRHAIGLYGDFAASALWGHFDIHRHDQVQLNSGQVNQTYANKYHLIQVTPVLELGLGFVFGYTFCNDYRLDLKVGWEDQIWFSFHQLNDPFFERSGNLTLQGLTVKGQFTF